MSISDVEIKAFLLILMRMSGLFVFAPFFNARVAPLKAKVAISFFLSLTLFSTLPLPETLPSTIFGLSIAILKETLIGFIIGTLLGALLAGVQSMGQIVGFQMGFTLIQAYDPDSDVQTDVIAQLKFLMAMVIFLLVNGHYALLDALVKSYELIPLGEMVFKPGVVELLSERVGLIFTIALKLGAPAIVALWVTNACLAILTRIIPQMNIFMVDFPIKICVGFLALAFSIPYFSFHFQNYLTHLWRDIHGALLLMKG